MKYRWESYVKYHGKDELVKFCKEFYGDNPKEKVLFLLGKGFDPRMNNTLALLLENVKGLQLDCLTFDFPDSGNHAQNRKLYKDNIKELEALQKKYGFSLFEIPIDTTQSWEKRIAMMSRQVAERDLTPYRDVILDVSSLPRAFYFNIAKAFGTAVFPLRPFYIALNLTYRQCVLCQRHCQWCLRNTRSITYL